MQCNHCEYPETMVVETRHNVSGAIKRRRECVRCGMRFTTHEMPPVRPKDDRFSVHKQKGDRFR